QLVYFANPTLAGARAPFRRIDAANQLRAGLALAPRVREARSAWVVSTLAPYGYPAARSGRRYACWLGTGLEDEWAARRGGLPAARALLIGRPPRGPLPERVEATGVVPSVPEHLRRATLLVVPSLQEGFGLLAAEALAAGVPAVSTPCGGPEALLRDSGGGVVLAGFSPEELAGAVSELAGDVARLSAMRRSGREHVEREHSPARFRELLGQAFRELDA